MLSFCYLHLLLRPSKLEMLAAFQQFQQETSAESASNHSPVVRDSAFSVEEILAEHPAELSGLLSNTFGLKDLITIVDDEGSIFPPSYRESSEEEDESGKRKPVHRHVRVSRRMPSTKSSRAFSEFTMTLLEAALKRDNKYLLPQDPSVKLINSFFARQEALLKVFRLALVRHGVEVKHDSYPFASLSQFLQRIGTASPPASLEHTCVSERHFLDVETVSAELFARRFEASISTSDAAEFLECFETFVAPFTMPFVKPLVAAMTTFLRDFTTKGAFSSSLSRAAEQFALAECFRWRVLEAFEKNATREHMVTCRTALVRRLLRVCTAISEESKKEAMDFIETTPEVCSAAMVVAVKEILQNENLLQYFGFLENERLAGVMADNFLWLLNGPNTTHDGLFFFLFCDFVLTDIERCRRGIL